MILWSESRMRQYRENDHREDALHFMLWIEQISWGPLFLKFFRRISVVSPSWNDIYHGIHYSHESFRWNFFDENDSRRILFFSKNLVLKISLVTLKGHPNHGICFIYARLTRLNWSETIKYILKKIFYYKNQLQQRKGSIIRKLFGFWISENKKKRN